MNNNIIAGVGINITNSYQPPASVTGLVRWNGEYNQYEIMTNDPYSHNNQWLPILPATPPTISIDAAYFAAMNWAMQKMLEEEKLNELMDKHPGLKDLKEKFEIMLSLVREHDRTIDK